MKSIIIAARDFIGGVEKAIRRDRQLNSLKAQLRHAERKGEWEIVERLHKEISDRNKQVIKGA